MFGKKPEEEEPKYAALKTAAGEFYHGSPTEGLTELREGTYVTPDRPTAELMGRFHADTGKDVV